jgi:hypothetical protein
MADWREDAAAAVDLWIASESRGGPRGQRTTLGVARPEGDGWYAVDLRGRQPNPDLLDGLRLTRPRDDGAYRVMDVAQEAEILRVRVARHVTERGLLLTATPRPPSLLLENLRDSLLTLTDTSAFAHRLVHALIDPLPSGSPEPPPSDLAPGQRQAFDACLVPGLRLVWGPPGTGKTRVLAEAIDRLLERGRRVLLVSGTNVAVDDALLAVVGIRPRPPGTLVRVGPPHRRAVSDDESVSLRRLVAARAASLEQERRQVEDRLVLLGGGGRMDELDRLLCGFDPAAYQAAAELLACERRVAAMAGRLGDLAAVAATAAAECDAAERARLAADGRWEAIQPARAHLAEAGRLREELADLRLAADRASAARLAVGQRRTTMRAHLHVAEAPGRFGWLRSRAGMQPLRDHVRRLDEQVLRAEQDAETARRLAEDQRRLLDPRIAEQERLAAPLDDVAVLSLWTDVEAARREATDAAERAREAADRVRAATAELRAAESPPHPTAEQRRLVEEAGAAGQPALHAEREELRTRLGDRAEEVRQLERRHEELLQEQERLWPDAEREVIGAASLVATTLARFRLHPDVAAGSYDAVLVDEAGASSLAEVLPPVAAARETAVLLGDFLQLGPVLNDVRKHPSPLVRRWLVATCFAHCGIHAAPDVGGRAGCAVLRHQHRLGPDVMELANRSLYAGTLLEGSPRGRSRPDHEVVLIDTDGLGDLGRARPAGRSRWWPAGSLLAPILAEHHARSGRRVGLIALYRAQAEAVLAALRDVESHGTQWHGTQWHDAGMRDGTAPLRTEVGTAHAFQGRELDVAVLDLVEDGDWRGWIADSRLTPESEGARLLSVGLTRSRDRLYLVGSAGLVAGTRPGTALAPVRELLREGRIHVVPATRLLQVPEAGAATDLDPVLEELAETLARHVRVLGIHGERSYHRELQGFLEGARQSIWLWSPWVRMRSEDLLAPLRAARDRGCRVVVFALADEDGGMDEVTTRALGRLRDAVTRVVHVQRVDQKIVVIDEETVLYGSLNAPSHRDRREIMVVHQGAHFARKLLEHEHADVLGAPPSCPCGRHAAARRSGSPQRGYSWHWRCATRTCGWTEQVRVGGEPATAGSG